MGLQGFGSAYDDEEQNMTAQFHSAQPKDHKRLKNHEH
jgi:hypothetical protein